MKEDGKTSRRKTSQRKNARRKNGSDGKIAGQGMKKDSVTTLLFQANNENFAELFNRTLLAGNPVSPQELDEENIKETAHIRVTKEGGKTTLEELTHSPELAKIRTPEYQTTEGGYNMCRGIQGMIQEGIREGKIVGLREGIREGEMKKAKEMSISLADMGMSAEKIAMAAGVSVRLVREWLAGQR